MPPLPITYKDFSTPFKPFLKYFHFTCSFSGTCCQIPMWLKYPLSLSFSPFFSLFATYLFPFCNNSHYLLPPFEPFMQLSYSFPTYAHLFVSLSIPFFQTIYISLDLSCNCTLLHLIYSFLQLTIAFLWLILPFLCLSCFHWAFLKLIHHFCSKPISPCNLHFLLVPLHLPFYDFYSLSMPFKSFQIPSEGLSTALLHFWAFPPPFHPDF